MLHLQSLLVCQCQRKWKQEFPQSCDCFSNRPQTEITRIWRLRRGKRRAPVRSALPKTDQKCAGGRLNPSLVFIWHAHVHTCHMTCSQVRTWIHVQFLTPPPPPPAPPRAVWPEREDGSKNKARLQQPFAEHNCDVTTAESVRNHFDSSRVEIQQIAVKSRAAAADTQSVHVAFSHLEPELNRWLRADFGWWFVVLPQSQEVLGLTLDSGLWWRGRGSRGLSFNSPETCTQAWLKTLNCCLVWVCKVCVYVCVSCDAPVTSFRSYYCLPPSDPESNQKKKNRKRMNGWMIYKRSMRVSTQ